jgi:hypothetical protein
MYEETVLYPWLYNLIINNSYERSSIILRQQLGVSYIEAMDWIETAKHFASHICKFARETERGVMISRVDRLSDDSHDASMFTTELNSMKLKMQAIGLTNPGEELNEDRQTALSSGLRERIKKRDLEKKQLKGETS